MGFVWTSWCVFVGLQYDSYVGTPYFYILDWLKAGEGNSKASVKWITDKLSLMENTVNCQVRSPKNLPK